MEKTEKWYDFDYDKELIIQSVAKQYGILPDAQEELHFKDWSLLVGGLMEDTPLGQIVLIRKESDKKRLKSFSPYEHSKRNEWGHFRAKQKLGAERKPEEFASMFEKMFAEMFGERRRNK